MDKIPDDSKGHEENAIEAQATVVANLLGLVNELSGNIRTLSESVVQLTSRTKLNRRLIVAVIIGFVLDISLTITMAFVLSMLATQNGTTQQLQNEQVLQRTEAICPLYQLFVNADTVNTRTAQKKQAIANGTDPNLIDQAWDVIHHSYTALNCKELVGGGR